MNKDTKDGMVIYVKDDDQKQQIQQRHPNLSAEFRNQTGDTEGMVPMVCLTKNGRERCEIGEDFIESFQKELNGNKENEE